MSNTADTSNSTSAAPNKDDNEWRPIGEAVGAGNLPGEFMQSCRAAGPSLTSLAPLVDVIESLCMQCHEQVHSNRATAFFFDRLADAFRLCICHSFAVMTRTRSSGNYSYAVDRHSLLQGSHRRQLQMRALW